MKSEVKVSVVKYPDRDNLVLRWTDPATGRQRTKSAKTKRRREAERAAERLERELAERKPDGPETVTWAEFLEAYQDEHLSGLARATSKICQTMFGHIERIVKPKMLTDLTGRATSR